jgi:hypothetical protein
MNGNQVGGVSKDGAGATNKEGTSNRVGESPAVGSETAQKGGKESAQRQAERDWENSSKESGE